MIAVVPPATNSFSQEKRPNSQPPIRLQTCATQPKLLVRLREALRCRHYSRRTEQTYCHWVKRFIPFRSRAFGFFHHVRHPAEMSEPEINAFLSHLAIDEKVSSSTQNQALSALLFLYRRVIGREVGALGDVIRARKPTRLPVVMTREEVKAVLANLTGDKWLMASLMYGAGLRSWNVCACEFRTSISPATRYWCAMARAGKTGLPCFPNR